MNGRIWMVMALAIFSANLAPPSVAAEIENFHQDMTVRLDPDKKLLTVRDRLTIDGGGQITLRLSENFIITAFIVDGRQAPPSRRGDDLSVNLGEAGRHDVTIEYTGQPDALLSPEGGYLPPAGGWHPVLDGSDFTFRIDVSVPAPQMAVAPGRLMEEHSDGETYRAVFASKTAMSGIVLLTGPYEIKERLHGHIRLRTYFYPELSSLADAYLGAAAGFLDLYENWLGPYPFSAFHIVSGPLPVGLGFEGLTYISRRALPLPFIRERSLGHEVLHNWWGNGVRVDYSSGNWSEGLTTYMADYTYARQRSASEARQMRLEWLRDFAALPASRDHALTSFRGRSHDSDQVVGYNKAAFVFHMLENEIGQKAFTEGLRLFWIRHKFKTAGWKNLQQAFEAASNKNLSDFFAQWTRRTGAPTLTAEKVNVTAASVTFTLGQTKLPYALRVPVSISTATGENRFLVDIKSGDSRVEIAITDKPLALAIDPDLDIFRLLDKSETPAILRDTTLDPATVVFLPDGDIEATATAGHLAERLLDGPMRRADTAADLPQVPLLIIGTTGNVRDFMMSRKLPATPAGLADRGTARVWAWRWLDGAGQKRPLLVIEAENVASLKALLRPLPHYRREGYLVFEGSKALEHGFWPATAGPLRIQLD